MLSRSLLSIFHLTVHNELRFGVYTIDTNVVICTDTSGNFGKQMTPLLTMLKNICECVFL